MKIYLDNAATTPIEPCVLEVMKDVLDNVHGNPSSIHQAGRKARTVIEDARKRVAQHLNASTGEIFFTSSATESNNMILHCVVRDLGITRIISSPTEHPCVKNTLDVLKRSFDIQVDLLSVDKQGNIDLDQLEQLLKVAKGPALVSLMHGNNEIGTMLDLEAVSKLCVQYDTLLHSDAVQTVGKFDLDLAKMKVNFLSASGHKIYGPKGIGIVYINSESMINPFIQGGGQERKMRSGTENTYGIAGFASALDWLVKNRQMHHDHIQDLRHHFKQQAKSKGLDIEYNGNQDDLYLYNILSVSVPKSDKTELIMFNLDIHGICASAGSACSSGVEYDSHVLEAIGAPIDRKTVRFSLSHNNTKEEIDYVLDKLSAVI